MKPEELLTIDFSKYNKFSINGVFIADLEIDAKDHPVQIELSGKVDGKLIMMTSFLKGEKIHISEISEDFLSIREVK